MICHENTNTRNNRIVRDGGTPKGAPYVRSDVRHLKGRLTYDLTCGTLEGAPYYGPL
jgi:hypothetical protein